ncbi:MAG: phospholipid carrier-dependent glycosyltransferase [Pseudomonadota bacterium]|uniref:Phospholipid carrier-dependent glycosyltransferase n=1 Tax=Candidatus Desulfatibia profunda TaxID=2841695 RepID=A0A8J6NUX4_9BACT|nr:phospholipid carrier-dependent glycosyltransferase [Candidatus Desulfatibia profunda]MBL7178829.1 phospholipid carrier-dependent glycosyltransferase [Desulfobacterales bacterium]
MGDLISKKINILIISLFLLLYIVPLGVRPIIIPDESRYAEIPREMIASGDWTVPRLNGLKYFEKPVLGYWLNAASIKLFGENAFAVRLPSAIATGFTALMILLLMRRFAEGSSTGIIAAAVFLTCFEVYGVGTFSVLDSILSMFLTGAMASFFFACQTEPFTKKKQGFLFLFGLFCGLAFLTKGFLAFAVPVLAIIPFLIWENRWKELIIILWLPLVAAVLIALPWAVMIHLKEPDYWNFFFWNEHVRRFMSKSAQHYASFWYYLLLLPAASLPWTFLWPAVISGLKKTGIKTSIVRYAVCWFFFPFLFFSVSNGKLLTYILPCFVPLAMLISIGLNRYFAVKNKKAFNVGAKTLAMITAGIAIALIVVQVVGFKDFKPYSQTWKWVLAFAGLATFTFFLLVSSRETKYKKKVALYALSPMLILLGSHFVVPDLTLQHKDLGEVLLRHSTSVRPDTILVSDEDYVQAVCWFYKRNDVYLLAGGGELAYGLQHDNSKNRLLTLEQFNQLIKKNRGRIVAVINFRKYQSWSRKLPKPAVEENNIKQMSCLIPTDGIIFARY